MKKFGSLLCTLMLLAFASLAQDVITLTNGRVIHANVLQITPTSVIYKDNDNGGPNLSVLKTVVATVVYGRGSTTIYNRTGKAALAIDSRKKIPDHGSVHGCYFGAMASGGVGTVTTMDHSSYTIGAGSTVVAGGALMVTPMITQHLGIQVGIGGDYYSYHVNYTAESIFYGVSNLYALRYLTFPIRCLYLSNSRRRVGFYASGGMDFSILEYATDNEQDFLLAYYRNVLISPYASCGVVLRNNNARGIWMLGPFFKSSLTNVYSGRAVRYEGSPFMGPDNYGNFISYGVTLSFMCNFGRYEQDGY